MIPLPTGVRVWIAAGHTDMRRGMQSLALQVQEGLKRDPHAGDLYFSRTQRPTTDILHTVFVLRRSPTVGTRCSGESCRYHRSVAARN
jgi:hypothetical protein